MSNIFKCFLCSKGHNYATKEGLMEHLVRDHEQSLEGLPPEQIYFNFKNRYPITRKTGLSVIYKKPTKWNHIKQRYDRFANDKEAEEYKRQFRERMQRVYGKTHLLDDPNIQKKMLSKRKISGEYVFRNGKKKTYTGSYERDLLEKLDTVFKWDPDDILAPAPEVIKYKDPKGKDRLYIPDFYIVSLDLLIEIKSEENQHYRKRDLPLELLKDKAAEQSGKHYIKVLDKNYADLLEKILYIRSNYPNDN